MKDKYSVQEVADLFGISRSTVKYWNEVGLTKVKKNSNNNYREYSIEELTDLCDVILYRKLNVPIKKIKNFYTFTRSDLELLYQEAEVNMNEQIQELKKTLNQLQRKKNILTIIKTLEEKPYRISKPDINSIVMYKLGEKESLIKYLESTYKFALYLPDDSDSEISYGLVVNDAPPEKIIYRIDPMLEYAEYLMTTAFSNERNSDLMYHKDSLVDMGYKTGSSIARYLTTVYDKDRKERVDLYRTWTEIYKS